MEILSIKSNMYGFNVTDDSLRNIYESLKVPIYIPSQELQYNAFPIAADPSGIQSTINIPVSNCSCISVMFPKNPNDLTVFENPMYYY